jgi:hypothetical protein
MEFNSRNYTFLQKWNSIPEITYFYKNGIAMIARHILPTAQFALTQFRAVCLTGPRQSGKTTLAKQLFKNKPYINFENPAIEFEASQDPQKFLNQYKTGAILDEVQRVPHIFRYLQGILDSNRHRGQFLLTGSNNFLLQEQVSQSLAGRAGYLSLLPFSYAEIKNNRKFSTNLANLIFTGGYPEIWAESLSPKEWLGSYVQTYVQRDVRLLRNITHLAAFTKFVYLTANYAGQILNRDDLARNTGVDTKTILAWLGLLESSYLIYLIQPWHNNLNKRIVKSPKLYFYDTGLLCHLLGISNQVALTRHSAYGAIFENWVISEIQKNECNGGRTGRMHYFRDNVGNEVDLVLERDSEVLAIEIKSGTTFNTNMLKGLNFWKKNQRHARGILVHAGSTSQVLDHQINLVPWMDVENI